MLGTSLSMTRSCFPLFITAIINLMLIGCQTLEKESDPKDHKAEVIETQKALVVSLLNKGLPNMAYKELRELIRQNPQDPDFQNLMGLTQLSLNNPSQAITFFNAAYKIDKKPSFVLNLSSALIETKQHQKAVTLLTGFTKQKSFKEYAYPERVYHNIALSFERMGKVPQAEVFYKKALNANTNYFISHMKLAALYERTKRLKLANESYSTALRLCPACSDPVMGMSNVYIQSNQPEKALKLLTNYLTQTDIAAAERARAESRLTQLKTAMMSVPARPTKSASSGKSTFQKVK